MVELMLVATEKSKICGHLSCRISLILGKSAVTFVAFIFADILLTRSHLVIMGSRAVAKYVFHLQELICAVASDDGESEALRALFQ